MLVPVFVQMCLASEAEKREALSSQPAGDTAPVFSENNSTNMDPMDQRKSADLPQPTPSLSSSSSSASSTPTDKTPPLLNQPKNVKKKKKDCKETVKADKTQGLAKKASKKRPSSESDLDSVIEAVAKGTWAMEETPTKTPCIPNSDISTSPELEPSSSKKKIKPKVKKPLKAKEEALEEVDGQKEEKEKEAEKESKEEGYEPQDVPVVKPVSPKGEVEAPCMNADLVVGKEEVESHSPLEGLLKSEERDTEAKPESCGSRKSERSCKGALYKTLVSEGMLTSLRANVDRGDCPFLLVILAILSFSLHFIFK